jgi:hypothetical protein
VKNESLHSRLVKCHGGRKTNASRRAGDKDSLALKFGHAKYCRVTTPSLHPDKAGCPYGNNASNLADEKDSCSA